MAIKFDEKAATISLNWAGVKPDITANQSVAVFHLTKGFKAPIGTDLPTPGLAWTATGRVPVSLSHGDSLAGHKFGFIQIMRTNRFELFYAGGTRKDGSAGFLPMNLVGGDIHMDSDGPNNPFAQPPSSGVALKPPVLSCTTGDHPHTKFGIIVDNSETKGENLLLSCVHDADFWTTLSLQLPGGAFIHLAHFKWSVHWEIDVRAWIRRGATNMATHLTKTTSATKLPTVVPGPPMELFSSGLKLDGVDRNINDKMKEALERIERGSVPPSAGRFNKDWFLSVPSNFFTPIL